MNIFQIILFLERNKHNVTALIKHNLRMYKQSFTTVIELIIFSKRNQFLENLLEIYQYVKNSVFKMLILLNVEYFVAFYIQLNNHISREIFVLIFF